MQWIEDIEGEAMRGVRVLAAQPSRRRAFEVGMEITRCRPEFTFQGLFVHHYPSGGFIHLAVDDEDVLGMEYHRSVGSVSAFMRSRVRLPYDRKLFSR